MNRKLRVYPMREEDVCVVSVRNRTKHLIVRGAVEQLNGGIMLDEITRKALEVEQGMTFDFRIEHAGVFQQIRWACTLADAGPRIAAWLAVISIALGIAGLILGAIGLLISLR